MPNLFYPVPSLLFTVAENLLITSPSDLSENTPYYDARIPSESFPQNSSSFSLTHTSMPQLCEFGLVI